MPEEYDVIVIGAGPGGYVAAIRASQLGARVAVVEKEHIGGTCLNVGCIPTKALKEAVDILETMHRASTFGVEVSEARVNFARVMERKNAVVKNLVGGVEVLLKGHKVDIYRGTGRILSPTAVSVDGEQQLGTRKIIIATGSVPARLPIPGMNMSGVLDSTSILALDHIPESLAVIGGGVIGIEFAQIFAGLGSKVTVLEMLPTLLPPVDEELARRLQQLLRQSRVDVHVGARVLGVEQKAAALAVRVETGKGEIEVPAENVLVATGRWPFAEGLGGENVGLAMNRRAVSANEYLETNVPGIYAIGDAIAGIMLAHLASAEGETAAANALGQRQAMDYTAVPNCIFSRPEIGAAGLTEQECKAQGIPYSVSKVPFTAIAKAQVIGETAGLVKIIAEEGGGRVLGVHIMGPHATDLIAEGTLAVQAGISAKELAHTIHAHPTLPEAIGEAAMGQFGMSIHFRRL